MRKNIDKEIVLINNNNKTNQKRAKNSLKHKIEYISSIKNTRSLNEGIVQQLLSNTKKSSSFLILQNDIDKQKENFNKRLEEKKKIKELLSTSDLTEQLEVIVKAIIKKYRKIVKKVFLTTKGV